MFHLFSAGRGSSDRRSWAPAVTPILTAGLVLHSRLLLKALTTRDAHWASLPSQQQDMNVFEPQNIVSQPTHEHRVKSDIQIC